MDIKLDHIGLVVENIREFTELLHAIGFREITEAVPFDTLNVTASFVNTGDDTDVPIEVLEPTAKNSPIMNFLKKKGGGLHHLCFEVNDIEKTSQEFVDKGFQMVTPPVDCRAYDINLRRKCKTISRIAFFLVSKKFLVELIEKGQ
ncbi:MAG: VOC family protein [Syntrophorhabdaceae bacterium]|nr:VOC family protein [Syntrophorhabdaceae bacterium]